MDGVELASGGTATLEKIAAELESRIDVLYLVCHGAIVDDKPLLYLENEAGEGVGVDGEDFAARIDALRQKPTLALLCSCQSAGPNARVTINGDAALVPLGPLLARVGVAAVLAMQDDIAMEASAAAAAHRRGPFEGDLTQHQAYLNSEPSAWSGA